jgi:hypothetical protein
MGLPIKRKRERVMKYLITVEVESEWSLDLLTRGQYGALIFGANHPWKIVEAKEKEGE